MNLEELLITTRNERIQRGESLAVPPTIPVEVISRHEIRHYENAIGAISEENIRTITIRSIQELELVVESIHDLFSKPINRGPNPVFNSKDIVFTILISLVTGWNMKRLAFFMNSDHSSVNRIILKNLAKFSQRAVQLWFPTRITAEQQNLAFNYFPEAFGAIDTTLLQVRIPQDKDLRKL